MQFDSIRTQNNKQTGLKPSLPIRIRRTNGKDEEKKTLALVIYSDTYRKRRESIAVLFHQKQNKKTKEARREKKRKKIPNE